MTQRLLGAKGDKASQATRRRWDGVAGRSAQLRGGGKATPVEARKDNETIEPAAAATTRRSLIGGCRVLFPRLPKKNMRNIEYSILPVMSELSTVRCDRVLGL